MQSLVHPYNDYTEPSAAANTSSFRSVHAGVQPIYTLDYKYYNIYCGPAPSITRCPAFLGVGRACCQSDVVARNCVLPLSASPSPCRGRSFVCVCVCVSRVPMPRRRPYSYTHTTPTPHEHHTHISRTRTLSQQHIPSESLCESHARHRRILAAALPS